MNRLEKDRLRKQAERRAKGIIPRAEYIAGSLSATRPWEALGISRDTWERRRKAAATPSAPVDPQLAASLSPGTETSRGETGAEPIVAATPSKPVEPWPWSTSCTGCGVDFTAVEFGCWSDWGGIRLCRPCSRKARNAEAPEAIAA
jgi:hypothetical protein